MITFKEFLLEQQVSKQDLNNLEKILDSLFAKVGIDIEFTKHFLDRVNDKRNREQITVKELSNIFRETYIKYSKVLKGKPDDFQAVLKGVMSNINVPFVINVTDDGELELVSKTVMRKPGFKTSNDVYKVSA